MVKIIKGTYGYWDGVKIVPMDSSSAPVELGGDEEERIVEKGIAEYVEKKKKSGTKGKKKDGDPAEEESDPAEQDAPELSVENPV